MGDTSKNSYFNGHNKTFLMSACQVKNIFIEATQNVQLDGPYLTIKSSPNFFFKQKFVFLQ